MKSGKGLFLVSVAAGLLSWVLNAVFEWLLFTSSGRTFLDCLIAGHPPPSDLTDGAAALEMILGAYQAAAERRAVSFPLPGGVLRPGTPPH